VTSYPRRSVGLVVTTNEPGAAQLVQQLPARAEQWGYDSLWVTDHTVGVRAMGGVYCDYWLDALTALTWIAATTWRVRLGTGVMVIPHRNPVLASKMITTIDVLSEGRVDLGVGTGWSRVEYRALGVESLFAQRGRVTDEAIEVMLACWKGGEIAFDVWHPHDLAPAELARIGDQLDELAGRQIPRSVRVHVTEQSLPAITDLIESYHEIGCISVVLEFRSQPCAVVTRLAERAAEALELAQPGPLAADHVMSAG
jgi:hypothetical protein